MAHPAPGAPVTGPAASRRRAAPGAGAAVREIAGYPSSTSLTPRERPSGRRSRGLSDVLVRRGEFSRAERRSHGSTWPSNLVINAPVMVFIRPAAGEPLGVDRFPRGPSTADAGTAANAAACRLVHPTRPIRPAAGANGPVVGGPATQKGGWRISFTPRSASLPFRSGAMTPFPGRAGAAAHPKVKRQPPFSVPAAVPDHDYGPSGGRSPPRDPAGGSGAVRRARCPATATRRPCRRRPRRRPGPVGGPHCRVRPRCDYSGAVPLRPLHPRQAP